MCCVSNVGPRRLYRNDGGGRFREVAAEAGPAFGVGGDATAAMTADWADADRAGCRTAALPGHAPPPTMKVLRSSAPSGVDPHATRVVRVGAVEIGGTRPVVIAGPCAVESREQTLEIALQVADAGADMLRGGAFEPRTSPYSFQGLGERGLEILAEARERTGLPVVTEVMDPRKVDLVAAYADMLQIGSRSMQNFPLLEEIGRTTKPVLLKRGWSATLEEWLGAAEYVALGGNLDVVLCERGIRTFALSEYSRNTLDLNVLPAVRAQTFLPVLVDPSHATGHADLVPGASRAAITAGAHGLILETIAQDTDRAEVRCDGEQSIRTDALREIVDFCRREAPRAHAG